MTSTTTSRSTVAPAASFARPPNRAAIQRCSGQRVTAMKSAHRRMRANGASTVSAAKVSEATRASATARSKKPLEG